MRRKRRQRLPKEAIVLEIEKLSHEGRGIAHLEGKVVFVEDALPGEQVSAVYTERRDAFDQAKTQTVLKASPHRIEPPCEYASICGGCSLQHFEPEAQLSFKDVVLHELLQHALGSSDYEHLPPLRGPLFAYRRKARLAVRYVDKKQQVLIGFREKSSSFITNMSHCEILDARVSMLLPALQELITGLQAYRQIPQIEVALGDESETRPDLALVFRHLVPLSESDQNRLSAFAHEHSLSLYLQGGGPDSVRLHYPAGGEERLYYALPEYDLELTFHPLDFTQINAGINHQMVHKALELLDLNKEDSVLDLFCGLGNFTLPAATLAGQVLGIEGSDEMVARGRENAARMELENVEFMRADLAAEGEARPWQQRKFTKILLDPPRSGAFEIIAELAQLKPQRLVYVSCNPVTLARDAQCLQQHGYTLAAAGVMDMFPQTTHVESIALFIPGSRNRR